VGTRHLNRPSDVPGESRQDGSATAAAPLWRRALIVAIKIVHTAAFLSIGSCLMYLPYSGLRRQSDRKAMLAGAVVSCEALIYAANGFRCPLTDAAEKLGSANGYVADVYLPRWVETHLPFITGPIFAVALMLHARNLCRRQHQGQRRQIAGPCGLLRRLRSWCVVRPLRAHVPGDTL